MVLSGASALYGAVAAWRRRWYAQDPGRRRVLDRPVVSVGNLSTGGRGKTPVVAAIARLLRARGERPAILSRGYARRRRPEGVTVVADATTIRADVNVAGDEPLMLARALPGVPVLVADDRHAAGRLAESRLGATVHVLDDGFQHLALARDVDLLLVDPLDLDDRVLPAGHLREPLDTLRLADAVLVPAGQSALSSRVERLAPAARVFEVHRAIDPPVWTGTPPAVPPSDLRVFAVAGVARPERFFEDLAASGWQTAGTMVFRDHQWFTPADVKRMAAAARAAGASAIVTTDKDAVRLEAHALGLPLARVPLSVTIDPPAEFADWLVARLAAASARSGSPARDGCVPPAGAAGPAA